MHDNFPGSNVDNRELENFLEDLRHASVAHLDFLMEFFFALHFPEEATGDQAGKQRPGRCRFPDALGDQYSPPIRDSASFKRLLTLHKNLHVMAEECLDKAAQGALTPGELSTFLRAAQRFQHFIDALKSRTTLILIEVDELTGVLMRNAMDAQLQEEWARAQRTGSIFCLAMVDADHFKRVNDEYGHAFGDVVLAELANRLVDGLRPYDRVYRYGGEEFLLLLPDTELEQAQAVLERLRASIAGQEISDGERAIRLTVSIGLTQFNIDTDVHGLIEQADAAMYRAKNKGRNRVMVAT